MTNHDTTRLPYFKFMVQDWLSGDVQALEMHEQGIFVNLLALMWRDGGTYSKALAVLQQRCRCDIAQIEGALNHMKELGIIYVDDDGFLRVKFIDEQLADLLQVHAQKVNAGRKGAAARYGKKLEQQSDGTAMAAPWHSDTDTDTDKHNALRAAFDECWKAYPNKSGSKHKAFQAFKASKAKADDVLAGIARYIAFVDAERRRGFKDLKYANGQTFFNQRRWECEYKIDDAGITRPDGSRRLEI